MTPLRQRMLDELEVRNYSRKTTKTYVAMVAAFAKFHGRSPEHLGREHVRAWKLHLIKERKLSWSYVNVATCALRFFYGVVLGRPNMVEAIPYAKLPKNLPLVLSRDEVRRFLAAIDSDVLRTVVMLTYAAGLRVSEVVHLRVQDIDSARMLIHVREGKGRKDRLVPLSKVVLEILRVYWRAHRPNDWLFPGRDANKPISTMTVERAVARARPVVNKRVTPHTLRHSFATHLLENGINIRVVQGLLGHASLGTTAIYNHVSRQPISPVTSPLDLLPGD